MSLSRSGRNPTAGECTHQLCSAAGAMASALPRVCVARCPFIRVVRGWSLPVILIGNVESICLELSSGTAYFTATARRPLRHDPAMPNDRGIPPGCLLHRPSGTAAAPGSPRGPTSAREPRREQRCGGSIDFDDECWVCLLGGAEIVFGTYVQLTVGPTDPRNAKPTAPTRGQRGWLR